MCEYIDNMLIACKPSARIAAGLVVYMLAFVLSGSANAAGCSHDSPQQNGEVRDGVARIYENGRFYYYNIVPPCSGPSCDSSKPTSLSAYPNAIANERSTSQTMLTAYYTYEVTRPSSFLLEAQSHYISPSFDELLRPPVF
ncbi:MAG: hypothetical protein SFV81_21445 [Pirellulaceae bacterium]|nr:hypothetical protein [Pirellulaceae bacterium]